jgi:hypothetical protein
MEQMQLSEELIALIDETLAEMEQLKKSQFSAVKVDLEPKDGKIGNFPVNGEITKKEEEEEEEEEEVEKAEEDEVEKAEDDKEDDKEEAKKKEVKKSVDVSSLKDGLYKKQGDEFIPLAKNDANENLVKSLVEKISMMEKTIQEIKDQPLQRKSMAFDAVPLKKSEEIEPLNKSQVLKSLLELKKSGKDVLTEDITKAELGGNDELIKVWNKYNK